MNGELNDVELKDTFVVSDMMTAGHISQMMGLYTDHNIESIWLTYLGSVTIRTNRYRQWFVKLLHSNGCRTVLDAACGTGIDSVMLLEEGFNVCSIDLSESMLMYAMKERWNRRREKAFENWIIEKANWLTLTDDIARFKHQLPDMSPDGRFDAVVCIGNSYAHILDTDGRQTEQRRALSNLFSAVKPGGLLIVDHRNYDDLLKTGRAPANNIYYNGADVTVTCSTVYNSGKPSAVLQHYYINESSADKKSKSSTSRFRKVTMPFYPHRLDLFNRLVRQVCGRDIVHTIYGDYKPVGEVETPGYYVHVIKKSPNSFEQELQLTDKAN